MLFDLDFIFVYCAREYYEAALDTIGACFDGTIDDRDYPCQHLSEALVGFMIRHGHAVGLQHIAAPTTTRSTYMLPSANA